MIIIAFPIVFPAQEQNFENLAKRNLNFEGKKIKKRIF